MEPLPKEEKRSLLPAEPPCLLDSPAPRDLHGTFYRTDTVTAVALLRDLGGVSCHPLCPLPNSISPSLRHPGKHLLNSHSRTEGSCQSWLRGSHTCRAGAGRLSAPTSQKWAHLWRTGLSALLVMVAFQKEEKIDHEELRKGKEFLSEKWSTEILWWSFF
jgi:hypothetical protein